MARQDGLSRGDVYWDSSGNKYEYDGDSWNQVGTGGAAHVYGLARNCVVQGAGTYNATEVLGFVCSVASSADWSITPKDGTAVTTIDKGTFAAGQTYPIHATSITVGTGGEALLFIP